MNREIKFRGKSKQTGEWLYGNYIASYNGKDWIESGGDFFAVDPGTVGQFTGFYDSCGKEIYEGHILKWDKDNRLYVIKYVEGLFYASVEEFNEHVSGGYPLYGIAVYKDEYSLEIVGDFCINKPTSD